MMNYVGVGPSAGVTVSSPKTLTLFDANTSQICTDASTITIPANATVAFPIGTEIQLLRSTSAVVTLALAAGVTATGRTGAANTLIVVTNYVLLKKIAINTWIVTSPAPSNPIVSLKRSTALSIPHNINTPIPLNLVEVDTDNMFVSANGTVTIPLGAEGLYLITVAVMMDPAQQVRAILFVNGVHRIVRPVQVFSADTTYGDESTRTIRLNVGDVVSLSVFQTNTTSTAKNLFISSADQACLQMTRTGA